MFSQHFELAAIVTPQKNFAPGFGSQKLDRLRACDRPIKFEISGFCKLQTAFFPLQFTARLWSLRAMKLSGNKQGAVTYSTDRSIKWGFVRCLFHRLREGYHKNYYIMWWQPSETCKWSECVPNTKESILWPSRCLFACLTDHWVRGYS